VSLRASSNRVADDAGENEPFDHAVAVFVHERAELTELAHTAHLAAIDSRRIEAIDDVD
jgi:hypothetical protein